MKNTILIFSSIFCFAISCQSPAEKNTTEGTATPSLPSLQLKWSTDTLMTTSESVVYDEVNDVIYVSNINGEPWAEDGNGFVSKIGLDGKIIERYWVKGMSAPKGMGIYKGHLFVNDNADIVEIDITSGKILKRHTMGGTKQLNDITIGADGTVYASTSDDFRVVSLRGDTVSTVLDSLDGPNGLLMDGDKFLMLLWNPKTLSTVDLATKKTTVIAQGLDNPDGVEAVGNGGYLVSGWQGLINYVDPNGERHLLLDTSKDKVSAADIDYVSAKKLLLVPTFFDNRVMAYEVGW
ncbi:MAG: ATP-binding protein [Bacteroidetes bacterium]|nr:ATP-binding protein [Bacteroidota bacterium]